MVHCLLHILSAHFVKTLVGISAGTRANKVEPALETQQQGFQQKHEEETLEKLLSCSVTERMKKKKDLNYFHTERFADFILGREAYYQISWYHSRISLCIF